MHHGADLRLYVACGPSKRRAGREERGMGDGEVQGEARMRGTGGTAVLQRGVPYTTSGAPAAVDVAGASKVCCCCLCLFLRDA